MAGELQGTSGAHDPVLVAAPEPSASALGSPRRLRKAALLQLALRIGIVVLGVAAVLLVLVR
jgi:hypothetical protein